MVVLTPPTALCVAGGAEVVCPTPAVRLGAGVALGALVAVGAKVTVLVAVTVALVALVGRGHEISDNWEASPKRFGLAVRELLDNGATVEAAPPLYDHQPYPYQAAAFYMQRILPLELAPEPIRERLLHNPDYYYLTRDRFAPLVLDAGGDPTAKPPYRILLGPTSKRDLVRIGTPPLPDTPAVSDARIADS